jgi:uncharacterized protein YbjT (DUF2867 family)
MDSILVTGGTGTLGRQVVRRLVGQGREVRVLTRQKGLQADGITYVTGDLLKGEGIDAAVAGVSTIIHSAGSRKGDEVATQHLVEAARRAGRPHIVFISVVGAGRIPVTSGIDRMMFSYFDMKRKAEESVANSGLPWTTLRATQFHDLMFTVVQALAKLPVVPFPSVSFQPVETGEVAARLVELAQGQPAGLVPDLAGPRIYTMKDLLQSYLDATGRHRLFVPLPMAGGAARAVREGGNLAPERAVGIRTWEEFLAERVGEPAESRPAAQVAR